MQSVGHQTLSYGTKPDGPLMTSDAVSRTPAARRVQLAFSDILLTLVLKRIDTWLVNDVKALADSVVTSTLEALELAYQ